MFNVEAEVILDEPPIAHLRRNDNGWLFYEEFFYKAVENIQRHVFKDYSGYDECVDTQLSYLENDLDIKDSTVHADKYFQLLGIIKNNFRVYLWNSFTRLASGNRIPDNLKKKIAYNAVHQKYSVQLIARSKLSESAFKSWADTQDIFIEYQRAFREIEKQKHKIPGRINPKEMEKKELSERTMTLLTNKSACFVQYFGAIMIPILFVSNVIVLLLSSFFSISFGFIPLGILGLKALLKRHEMLFDGTLGEWKGEPIDIKLKEGSKRYYRPAMKVPHIH